MPPVDRFHCDTCDFEMPSGWGVRIYAINDKGERVLCAHPGEHAMISMITGLSLEVAIKQNRVVHLSSCVCVNCLHQGEYDIEFDPRLCPACSKGELYTSLELVGGNCPKCEDGSFIRTKTGVMC